MLSSGKWLFDASVVHEGVQVGANGGEEDQAAAVDIAFAAHRHGFHFALRD